MRRVFIAAFILFLAETSFAQTDTITTVNTVAPTVRTRTSDHLMIQLGVPTWLNRPDSIRTGGIPRSFNMYVMLAFPFKTNPNLSIALGPGISTDNIFLERMSVGIRDNTPSIRFRDVRDTINYKKYKVATAFLELPVELRFSSNPLDHAKSVKVALGAKIGTLLSSWVKGKNLQDKNGNQISNHIFKEKSKQFFNTTRISATARVGYGHFSLFGNYALTPLFKEGLGPKMNTMTVGLTISGL